VREYLRVWAYMRMHICTYKYTRTNSSVSGTTPGIYDLSACPGGVSVCGDIYTYICIIILIYVCLITSEFGVASAEFYHSF